MLSTSRMPFAELLGAPLCNVCLDGRYGSAERSFSCGAAMAAGGAMAAVGGAAAAMAA